MKLLKQTKNVLEMIMKSLVGCREILMVELDEAETKLKIVSSWCANKNKDKEKLEERINKLKKLLSDIETGTSFLKEFIKDDSLIDESFNPDEIFGEEEYTIIAWVKNQEVVAYKRFGDEYEGDWVLVSKDKDNYYIYKDYYGSCSHCDPLENFIYRNEPVTKLKALKLLEEEGYKPFLVVPKEQMVEYCKNGKLSQIFPKNIRREYGEVDEFILDLQDKILRGI
jgi:hypothetical protein